MAFQINKQLTTTSGFIVPTGSYVWVRLELGSNRRSEATAKLEFFKDKAALDIGRERFQPSEIPVDKQIYVVPMPIQALADLTYMQAHVTIQSELNSVLGGIFVDIVA
jgi:hypothetical protein